MCGINGILIDRDTEVSTKAKLRRLFSIKSPKIDHRGPDRFTTLGLKDAVLDFRRLSIMDVSTKGDQPFISESNGRTVYVLCNGEIYEHEKIVQEHGLEPKSKSDCEVIMLLYKKYGSHSIDIMCEIFNSEHAFVILDIDMATGDFKMWLSNDHFGKRPLFVSQGEHYFSFSSELQGLVVESESDLVQRFRPRHYGYLEKVDGKISEMRYTQYCDLFSIPQDIDNLATALVYVRDTFEKAVLSRLPGDRPIGSLLSGGVDSSLVSAVASRALREKGQVLRTFSIGMAGGTDEAFAKLAAEHIGSIHTHILVSEQEFIDAIPDVCASIGSFDITTVRASVGQYLVVKWISENTDIKILLCGDGIDELAGSYKYFHNAPSEEAFHAECVRLLNDIHFFDGKRADRCIARFGIEARFPALDYTFVVSYLRCKIEFRLPRHGYEKWLFRQAFKDSGLLPNAVLWRSKEAFSDGVSKVKRSWYQIANENLSKSMSDSEFEQYKSKFEYYMPPITKEAASYRVMFAEKYGYGHNIARAGPPYFWLPKWCGDITDPSARILSVYDKTSDISICTETYEDSKKSCTPEECFGKAAAEE